MSGDYLTNLRIRIEPGPGVVASLGEVLLAVPIVEQGQEGALEALLVASTRRPVGRAVARVVADLERDQLPPFCLVVAGEEGGPFALVHGPVVLRVAGGGEAVRVSGLEARLWVEQALPLVIEHLSVRLAESGGGERLVLAATFGRADPPATDTPATGAAAVRAKAGAAPGGDPPDVGPAQADDRGTEVFAALSDEASDAVARDVDGGVEPADPARSMSDEVDRGRAVIPAPASVSLGAGSVPAGFRPEPVRFGDGGRMEAIAAPSSAAVNGWHEHPAVVAPSSPASAASSATSASATSASATPAPATPAPATPAPEAPPALPVRRPQTTIPPQASTQLVPPPSSGLFPGPVPPPVSPGFDPFGAAAPRPPESGPMGEQTDTRRILGRLVMEYGPDVIVDSDCVIGRNPEVDPDVAHGRAKPVVLPDEEQRISRVHARLVFAESGVEIVDAGSVNGTWIEPPGGDGWIAMVPRVPAPLPLGSRIQVGDLILTYLPQEG